MRYAFFGDIHGNYHALEVVLEDIEKQNVDLVVCMGDIVGYGAQPVECLEKVRSLGCLCLAGNHDHAAIGKIDIVVFNMVAQQATLWTREQLSDEHMAYLASLSIVEHFPDFVIVHGSLHGPEMFNYIVNTDEARMSFSMLDKPLMFNGHTHIPLIFIDTEPITFTREHEVEVDPQVKTMINVGSVGQPRDGDPRASYAVYDSEENKATICRLDYDIDGAVNRIRKEDLPEILAERLKLGQ